MDMEQHVVSVSGKCRRKYAPEHALFAAGNALRMTKFYVDAGVSLSEEEQERTEREPVFACRLFNCNGVSFHSLRAYEEHYDLVHRNVCQECFRSFLSFRLLDLHISESHDAFFRVLAKQKPMYVCLVDGCEQVFKHDDKRTKHLVNDHGYPANFSFRNQRRRVSSKNPPKVKAERNKPHEDRDVDAIKIAKAQVRKAKRKEKKKQLRAAAEVGDQEMEACPGDEQEDVPREEKPSDEETQDAEMEQSEDTEKQLSERMAQLQFVPKSVSFGRRQRQRP